MPTLGGIDNGSILDAGPGFGSAFGVLSPQANSPLNQSALPGFGGSSTMLAIGSMLSAYNQSKWGSAYGGGGLGQGQSVPQTGSAASLGGDWAGVDAWNSDINAASAKYGVPANLIKAVMKLESNGDPNSAGAAGVWGPMQVNSDAWGYGPWSTDPHANIDKGVQILADAYRQYGDWSTALRAYHGFGSDGYTTDQQYADIVNQNWQQLDAAGRAPGVPIGPTQGGLGGSTGGGGLGSVLGNANANAPISQDFGYSDFVVQNPSWYTYETAYGLDGTEHPGIDIAVPYGTNYYAPMAGVVTCGGTGNGNGADGMGCAAFGDTDGGGAGRVEVQLDNGVVLIFGHSSASALQPGMRFQAGQLLGASGSSNGAHIHLEARVRDNTTESGWRIVDPRTVLGGGVATGVGGSSVYQAPQNPYYANWIGNR